MTTPRKQKLELTWIGKENRPRLEPRILLEDPSKSYHAAKRVSENDLFDNRLIFGDNLLALKALEAEFAGKIKCIYIDPPYNTGSAFTHYDDGIEHSLWLSLIRDRLELLRRLLRDDGSIWVQIDDNEHAYLKVLMDEIYGRANFVGTVIWQKKYAAKSDSKFLSESHDYIVAYAKDLSKLSLQRLPKSDEQNKRYTNRDNDPRGPWKAENVLRTEAREYAIFPIKTPSGREVHPPKGASWRYTKDRMAELIADNRIWFGLDGSSRPAEKRFLSEVTDTMPATTMWLHADVGHNDEAKREAKLLVEDRVELFATPKPERLMRRILSVASDVGDWVLDSFAGSGTTGAVAHKMGRRWIMVELGEHCHTHIIPRLRKVIDGEDKGGVTEASGWNGGGGFRYSRIAPSLLEKDRFGNWVISREFNAAMLAEALCKLEGFTYAPSDTEYWRQGHSTERDFVFVTTQSLTRDMLASLSDEVGEDRTLLVLCKAFRGRTTFPNLTVKKIPKAVLTKCEWGKDDYSLAINALPPPQEAAPDALSEPKKKSVARGSKKAKAEELALFEVDGASPSSKNGARR